MQHHRIGRLHQESEHKLLAWLGRQEGTKASMLTAESVRRFCEEEPTGSLVVSVDLLSGPVVVTMAGFFLHGVMPINSLWSLHMQLSAGGVPFGVKASWDASFQRMSFR